ncbi:MAG TPA: cytochrome c oxidase subunit II [Gaiellaceae bacterium]|nr:cytochrome c oxidase subunit II [Gaiellaceae bacterium]
MNGLRGKAGLEMGNVGTRGARVARLVPAALAIPLVAAGCGGSEQSTLSPESHASREIAQLWWVMLIASAIVFGVVLVLLAVALLRRRGPEAPPARTGSREVWIPAVGGVAAPVVILVGLFAITLHTLPATSPAAGATSSLTIRVTGRQWFWDVEYPGRGVRTANEIHIPVGVPVDVEAVSGDVIHSFWVPELNRKVDMIPGRVNHVRLQAERAGVYRGQCAEFCGLQHAHMAFEVVAEPRARFAAWLTAQAREATAPTSPEQQRGLQVLLGSACVYCHTIAGTNASGRIGPDLTHFASRRSIGAATLPNTRGYLAGWILDPQHLKPGNKMPGTALSGDELQPLLDYLQSLR